MLPQLRDSHANLHLAHHDVTLLAVSRAPYALFQPFKTRMGWDFKWVSSEGSDFNFDYHVSYTKESMAKTPPLFNFGPKPSENEGEAHGISVFFKNESEAIFHTYSCYTRGGDILIGTHNYLDLTPKWRNEKKHHGLGASS